MVLDTSPKTILNSLYRVHFEFSGLVKVLSFSKRHSKSDASPRQKLCLFCWNNFMKLNTNTEKAVDLLATKIAELKLSELGYHFIPGITPSFIRSKKFIETKALIIKSVNYLSGEGNSRKELL